MLKDGLEHESKESQPVDLTERKLGIFEQKVTEGGKGELGDFPTSRFSCLGESTESHQAWSLDKCLARLEPRALTRVCCFSSTRAPSGVKAS